MKKFFLVNIAILVAVVSLALLLLPSRGRAAWTQTGIPIGANCTIQFRRDALGAASGVPVPPLTGSFNGADTCVAGKLKSINNDWLVLDHAGHDLWVPKAAVLLFEVNR
jgi:hypothetical protein